MLLFFTFLSSVQIPLRCFPSFLKPADAPPTFRATAVRPQRKENHLLRSSRLCVKLKLSHRWQLLCDFILLFLPPSPKGSFRPPKLLAVCLGRDVLIKAKPLFSRGERLKRNFQTIALVFEAPL